jgi:transposase InsO family protein
MLRKTLTRRGLDAGADTIAAHLATDPSISNVPAISTIWRILKRRGFVTPQPHKRPRSSWKRFEAELPNQRWQADVTTGTSLTAAARKSSTSSTTTLGWPSPAWPGAPSPAPT